MKAPVTPARTEKTPARLATVFKVANKNTAVFWTKVQKIGLCFTYGKHLQIGQIVAIAGKNGNQGGICPCKNKRNFSFY